MATWAIFTLIWWFFDGWFEPALNLFSSAAALPAEIVDNSVGKVRKPCKNPYFYRVL